MNIKQFLAENLQSGETYAGLIFGKNGERDYHLFLRPEMPEKTNLSWKEAMKWAKSIGYELPTQREASLLAINCRESFDLDDGYWTSTQSANHDGYALMQNFGRAYQNYHDKLDYHRARAIRRIYVDAP
mgnify:CR=1 FL=1